MTPGGTNTTHAARKREAAQSAATNASGVTAANKRHAKQAIVNEKKTRELEEKIAAENLEESTAVKTSSPSTAD